MSRKKQKFEYFEAPFKRPQLNLKSETRRGVVGIVFIVLAILFGLSLTSLAGPFGQVANKVMKLAFGWIAYGIPVVFLLVAFALFRQSSEEENDNTISTHAYVGGVFLILTLTGILHLWVLRDDINQAFELVKIGQGGGYLGVLTSYPLIYLLGFVASLVVLVAGFIVSILVTFNVSLRDLFGWIKSSSEEKPKSNPALRINNANAAGFVKETIADLNRTVRSEKLEPVINNPPDIKSVKKFTTPSKTELARSWKFPPLDLLDDSKTKVDSGNIEMNVSIIQKTLADFGIEVEMGEVNVGPTVTQYTLRPAVGVKLSQIASLQNDLALSLSASSIRMELPIPGKALVGIEIPNKTSALVRIREILQQESLVDHHSKLAFALGRDVAGHPMVSDLARMPHLLIAGATGTGKSVCINTLLISFLYRTTPDEVKLIVIDPKRVELSLYNGLPHLMVPIVTDYRKAVNALKWSVLEMDRRYKLLSEVHKRNIVEYNSSVLVNKLPYLIVVVDELADLMSVAQNEVEAAIVRLAQMARAVGIHLVLATQRPSVDVITGLIKANVTARIAFTVASQVDSRTILDMAGAEKLLGSGDMLFVTADMPKPKRVQGAYIGEKEVKRVTDFLRDQAGDVIYNEEILEKPTRGFSIPGFDSGDNENEDELEEEALDLIKRSGKASATLLQRHLRIGYSRAARLLDVLENKGIVGPADGAKPREVYVAKEQNGFTDDEDEEENNSEKNF